MLDSYTGFFNSVEKLFISKAIIALRTPNILIHSAWAFKYDSFCLPPSRFLRMFRSISSQIQSILQETTTNVICLVTEKFSQLVSVITDIRNWHIIPGLIAYRLVVFVCLWNYSKHMLYNKWDLFYIQFGQYLYRI